MIEVASLFKGFLDSVKAVSVTCEVKTMSKVPAYNTDSLEYPPEHRNVYHDHSDCKDGKKILPVHKKSGTGGKQRCKECIKLG